VRRGQGQRQGRRRPQRSPLPQDHDQQVEGEVDAGRGPADGDRGEVDTRRGQADGDGGEVDTGRDPADDPGASTPRRIGLLPMRSQWSSHILLLD